MADQPTDPTDDLREGAREAAEGVREASTAMREASAGVREASASVREASASVREASASVREAVQASRQAASLSGVVAATTREAVRQAIDEARRAIQDVKVEVRIERMSREESRLQTRERLLDAAAEVFNRLGYHGASLEAVAEAAGYTKGAVYSNFATKGELFAALMARFTERRVSEQEAIMEHGSIDELADFAGPALAQQRREQESWDLLQIEFWLAAMRDPALLALMAEGADDLYRSVGERFERKFVEAGLTPPFTGAEFARVVNALGSGLLLQLYVEPDAVDPALFGRAIRMLAGLPVEAHPTGESPDAAGG